MDRDFTVGRLKEVLNNFPDDTLVILEVDGVGGHLTFVYPQNGECVLSDEVMS